MHSRVMIFNNPCTVSFLSHSGPVSRQVSSNRGARISEMDTASLDGLQLPIHPLFPTPHVCGTRWRRSCRDHAMNQSLEASAANADLTKAGHQKKVASCTC